MRLLHRRRLDDDVLVTPALAMMRETLFRRPRPAQKRHGFIIALAGFFHRNAEAVDLAPSVALANAEIEPAVGRRSNVAACSARSAGLCQGSTSTAVPSRIVEVLAAR